MGIYALHIKLCGKGGYTRRLPAQGARSALRALARAGMRIGKIEDIMIQQEERLVEEEEDSKINLCVFD